MAPRRVTRPSHRGVLARRGVAAIAPVRVRRPSHRGVFARRGVAGAAPWRVRRHQVAAGAVGLVVLVVAPALAPVAAAAVLAMPAARARWRGGRDRRAADAELPEVLESVARSLRAGSSLGQAIVELPPPRAPLLRDDWARLRAAVPMHGVSGAVDAVWPRQAAGGAAPAAALGPNHGLVAAALRLAADVGGPQARALDLAAATLRQRLAIDGEMRAQAAQARASALVVASAPIAFAVLAGGTDPRYVAFLTRTVPGALLLYAGLALDAAGWAWMSRLARTTTPAATKAGGAGAVP
jgi:tight adherence protein B